MGDITLELAGLYASRSTRHQVGAKLSSMGLKALGNRGTLAEALSGARGCASTIEKCSGSASMVGVFPFNCFGFQGNVWNAQRFHRSESAVAQLH
jgi:hypothetical protein